MGGLYTCKAPKTEMYVCTRTKNPIQRFEAIRTKHPKRKWVLYIRGKHPKRKYSFLTCWHLREKTPKTKKDFISWKHRTSKWKFLDTEINFFGLLWYVFHLYRYKTYNSYPLHIHLHPGRAPLVPICAGSSQ